MRRAGLLCALVIACLVAACGSPTPSAAPSPSPVQAAPDPRLVEFEGHIADALRRHGLLVQALASASAGSPAQLRAAADKMADWARAENAWLDEHPPDACYQAAADTYRTGVESILTAANAFVELSAASPPTDAAGQAAGKGLSEGRASLDAAAAEAKGLRAACRS